MTSLLRPFQGRSSVLLSLLIPVASVILYYCIWDRSQFEGSGGIYWTPPDSSSVEFVPAVLFDSFEGDANDAKHTSILVHFLDNNDADACTKSSIQDKVGIFLNGSEVAALAIEKLLDCYPEEIAKAAEDAGYTMVIIQSPFYAAGFQAVQVWKSNSAPIPIVEVNYEANVEDMHLSYINVSTSENILDRAPNQAVLYVLSVFIGFLGGIQILKAHDRISGLSLRPSQLNTRAVTCILQLFSGCFRSKSFSILVSLFLFSVVVFSVDLLGCFHRINYVFFRILLSMGIVFVFATIFAVAFAYHFALVRLSGGPTSIRKVKSFWGIGVVIFILIVVECLAATYSVALSSASAILGIISAVNAFLFQLISGIYFVWTKHKVVSNLKQYGIFIIVHEPYIE